MARRVTDPGYHKGRIPPNKGKTYPPEILTPDEVLALLDACSPVSSTGLRTRAAITILYRAGLRCSEALALYPKDVDTRAHSITVLHGKGDRRRTVGIDPGATGAIEQWSERRRRLGFDGSITLLCTLTGRRMSGSHLREVLPRLARNAGIEKRVHPHGFRHTHAYELMMEGIPMPIIQRQLGHASLAATDAYLNHIAPRDVIVAIAQREWRPGG